MTITWKQVAAIVPGLVGVAAGVQKKILAVVNKAESKHLGGDTGVAYRLARIYAAAHLALDGSATRGYEIKPDRLASTAFGRHYLTLETKGKHKASRRKRP